MQRLFQNLQKLGELGELLEPTPKVAPGVEHVMTEIAPGVFRSVHRQKSPPASRLLRELGAAKQLHDTLKGSFAEFKRVKRDAEQLERAELGGGIPEAHYPEAHGRRRSQR